MFSIFPLYLLSIAQTSVPKAYLEHSDSRRTAVQHWLSLLLPPCLSPFWLRQQETPQHQLYTEQLACKYAFYLKSSAERLLVSAQ